ncbi:MAG TPA: alpha/beta hydrolase, partial [Pseudolabrys sp.]|nr:alpha/beta hydrolase [Pseudolabrys sp.]
MTTLKWFILIAVLGYGGLLALMYIFQRALLYFPDPRRTAPAAVGLPQADEVTLTTADGENLI